MDSERSKPRSRRPRPRRLWNLLGLAVVAIAMSIAVGGAAAAVPTFPDNLVVFPNRDFISAEGFSAHTGETALVTVTRPGTGVVGSTEVLLGPGDVPFEVNHPGGFCWGNNTDLQVTPDIVPGDEVSVAFTDGTTADVTTQDAFVTGVDYVNGATTFTVVGHIGAGVDPANTEQRIVNPDLTDTAVGRRDIRAVPGPLAPDRNNSYESSLEFVGDTFTATYVFTDAAVARIAATGGGERLLSWQNTDVNGNRQGITIAEFGELGGPGMGGCPNGPLVSGPSGPSGVTAANVAGGIRVNWTPAVAIPGTPAITGYRVHAVAQGVTGGNEQVEIGRRISGQADTGTTITGLLGGETYDVYVVSVSSSGETFPAIHAIPVTDVTPPTVSADPAGGTFAAAQDVTLTADEPNAQIYYTLDGSPVLDAPDQPAAVALTYTGSINIATTTTLRAVAFDPSGNASPVIEEIYTIDAAATVSASAGPDQEVSIDATVNLDGTGSTAPVDHLRVDADQRHVGDPHRRRHGDADVHRPRRAGDAGLRADRHGHRRALDRLGRGQRGQPGRARRERGPRPDRHARPVGDHGHAHRGGVDAGRDLPVGTAPVPFSGPDERRRSRARTRSARASRSRCTRSPRPTPRGPSG